MRKDLRTDVDFVQVVLCCFYLHAWLTKLMMAQVCTMMRDHGGCDARDDREHSQSHRHAIKFVPRRILVPVWVLNKVCVCSIVYMLIVHNG